MSEEQNIESNQKTTIHSQKSTENENISEPTTINYLPSTNLAVHKYSHHVIINIFFIHNSPNYLAKSILYKNKMPPLTVA